MVLAFWWVLLVAFRLCCFWFTVGLTLFMVTLNDGLLWDFSWGFGVWFGRVLQVVFVLVLWLSGGDSTCFGVVEIKFEIGLMFGMCVGGCLLLCFAELSCTLV